LLDGDDICRLAYDGKGNAVVKSLADLEKAMVSLGGQKQGLYGEKWVNFTKVHLRTFFPISG
jgi:phosphoribosylaminoimidazole carboxylase (NCAIR synthetase)